MEGNSPETTGEDDVTTTVLYSKTGMETLSEFFECQGIKIWIC